MGKKLVFAWSPVRAVIAGLLVLHGFLAGFAPCPYRSDVAVAATTAGHEHHAAHQTATSPDSRSTLPCPFDLMHALYGVFHGAPPPLARVTLAMAVTFTVSADPIGPYWLLSRRFDPPPRFA